MSGIFTLGQVSRKQEGGTWGRVSDVFLTEKGEYVANTYGYAGGGPDTSLIFRIDFANDASEAPARSRTAKSDNWHCASVASKNYGYWNGNYPGDSGVERLDFANDTAINVVVSNLTRNLFGAAPVHNLDYGYFAGGGAPGAQTTVDRIDFGNDTATSLARGPLAVASEWALGGTGNQSYGYVAGGSADTAPTTMNRIDYASDSSTATPKGPLSVARGRCKAIGNSAYGYWAGGGPSPLSSIVDRIDFSSDTTTMAPKGNLPVAARGHNTTGHHNSGYFCSGNPGPSNNARLDYDNDTVSPVQKGYLAAGAAYMGSGTGNRTCGRPIMSNNYSSGGVPYGYFAGGDEPGAPGQVSKIDRLDYDNDTVTMLHRGNLIGALEQCSAWSTLDNFYTTNGNGNKVLKLSYANDLTRTSERSTWSNSGPMGRCGVMQNINYAYLAGGPHPAGISTIQRISFANDCAGSSPKGPLSAGRYAAGGLSNQSYGYIMGGYVPFASPASKSWVDRLDFANDTATAVAKSNLPTVELGTTGSSTFAYGYLGLKSLSSLYRIDYSSDTTAATPKGPLTVIHDGYAGSTSNSTSYGYWAGGDSGTSINDRLDFSSDTTTAVAKGTLSAGRRWVWEGASSSKEAVLQGGMTSHSFGQTVSSSTTDDPGRANAYLTGQDWDYSAFDQLSISPGYGYFMGGGTPGGSLSQVDRIEFGNDTADAVVKGNLSHISRRLGAFTSLNYGYRCGGFNADTNAAITDIERLDYTNDTGTLGDAGYLTLARHYGAGLSTKDYGYLGGGEDPSSVKSTVDRLDFSTDTSTAVAKGPLTVARKGTAAVMSADYGYWGAGTEPSNDRSTVDRIDFASDTTACVTKGPLSEARGYLSGTNSADFGYLGGGYQPSSPYQRSTVDKIDFSNDTATPLAKGPLSIAKHNGGSTGNETYGYWGGGETPSVISTVDRLDYSNDTLAATVKGPLTVAKGEGFAGTSNRALTSQRKLKGLNNILSEVQGPLTSNTTGYAYWGGGYSPNTTVDRVDYSNDTATALVRGSTSSARYKLAGVGNQNYGYFGGGVTTAPTTVSTVDRLDYRNDTSVMAPKGPLSVVRRGQGLATGNLSYGYWCGGQTPSTSSEVDRVDYGNDLVAATPKGPLSLKRSGPGATGTQSYGYIGGGEPGPSRTSTIDRVDYSNDTATGLSKGPLTVARDNMGAAGNSSYGWWGGGTTGSDSSVVDRLDYSSDTTCVAKGPLTAARWQLAASSNTSHGYFGGGYEGGSTVTKVDRVDFSSDTATASPKGNLTGTAHRFPGSFSPQDCGFPGSYTSTAAYSNAGTSFGGYCGSGLYRKTDIERMDYSNDSANPIFKANFPRGLQINNGAVSSLTSGYWIGGEAGPSAHETSTIHRLDYANDTNVMTVGHRTGANDSAGAMGNKNYGYTAMAPATSMERLDYSNDYAGMMQRSTGNPEVHERGATASANYGYYNSSTPSQHSDIVRLDFANDTVAASQRCHLTHNWESRSSAVGNVDYGWWFGGGTPTPAAESTVNRVDYSNDTATAQVRGYLPTTDPYTARFACGHGNENYGYVLGFNNTNIQRIDYSNDMATPAPRGQTNLQNAGGMSAGTSCRENSLSLYTIDGKTAKDWQFVASGPEQVLTATVTAYFVGGESPGYETIVQRLNYANDTATAVLKGSIPVATKYAGGVSSQSYAYIGGNNPAKSDIYRLDYSNDDDAMAPKGNISSNKRNLAGIGNLDYGYMGGGYPGPLSTVDRIDYSSDTGTTPSKGPLSSARHYPDAVGNLNYGYWGGGDTGSYVSTVDRMDYSSDSTACATKGPLTVARLAPQGTGNADYGYLAAGHPYMSSIDRIDYSNDTPTASPKGPLNRNARYGGSTGNKDFGYFTSGDQGANPAPSTSEVYRLDYANDTNVAVSKGPLAVAQDRMAAASAAESGFPQ